MTQPKNGEVRNGAIEAAVLWLRQIGRPDLIPKLEQVVTEKERQNMVVRVKQVRDALLEDLESLLEDVLSQDARERVVDRFDELLQDNGPLVPKVKEESLTPNSTL